MPPLRTPDERFRDLPGFPFEAKYTSVGGPNAEPLRIHYVDEGPPAAPPVLLLRSRRAGRRPLWGCEACHGQNGRADDGAGNAHA